MPTGKLSAKAETQALWAGSSCPSSSRRTRHDPLDLLTGENRRGRQVPIPRLFPGSSRRQEGGYTRVKCNLLPPSPSHLCSLVSRPSAAGSGPRPSSPTAPRLLPPAGSRERGPTWWEVGPFHFLLLPEEGDEDRMGSLSV